MKFLVVGAGTAGLVSALILKTKFPQYTVDVVYSEEIGTIGVGEGATEHWESFMNFVGITPEELIRDVDASCKSGVMFRDWGSKDYIQNVAHPLNARIGQYQAVYAKLISEGVEPKYMSNVNNWDCMVDKNVRCPTRQFHFDTNKLNVLLKRKCNEKNIGLFEDKITSIDCDGQTIKSISSDSKKYDYDFYIDCTGFRKDLISKLGAKWQSYSDYLHVNSAVIFPMKEDIEGMWSLSTAMKYGWLFKVPIWGRSGNGYIYDSDYITKEQAIEEIENKLGHTVNIIKELKFDPGRLDKFWIGNCLSVGLSSSFVEPLEASSIASTIVQMFMFMNNVSNYNDAIVNNYNKTYAKILDNVRDFIVLHYLCDRNDTEFWKKCKTTIPESLKTKLKMYKVRLPLIEDFLEDSSFAIFNSDHYILVMYGLGLFDTKTIKEEYDQYKHLHHLMDDAVKQQREYERSCDKYSHKEYLNTIRNQILP
jgi:tryptophan halogenase